MKKAVITIPYDGDRLTALRLYMGQKELSPEAELTAAIDALYAKHVPSNVREYIGMSRSEDKPKDKPRRAVRPAPPESSDGS